jgi:hypothetical protein
MAVIFSYGGTTCTFSRDPAVGDVVAKHSYKNPRARSVGGVPYVYDKDIVKEVHQLSWSRMKSADLTSLLTFLDVVDGGANAFDYTDVSGTKRPAFIWNANEIRSVPAWHMTEGVVIEVLIAPDNILLDETGSILSDESYKALMEDDTIPANVIFDENDTVVLDEGGFALLDQTEQWALLDEGGDSLFDENYTTLTEE